MKTILVVDDEKDIIDVLRYNLLKENYTVLSARNGKEALEQSKKLPDLILLDVMMPDKDGFDVIKELKKQNMTAKIPVIFLTAKGTEIDEVVGLELGAEDYIIKPISIPKLIARIKNVLRKGKSETIVSKTIIGAVEIIPAEHIVRIEGQEIFFPKKEFEILNYLATHSGQVINREALLKSIWGLDVFVVDRTVDVHIRKIREKLGKYADYIDTIKGIGYRMREPI